jgi:hypothetical protein
VSGSSSITFFYQKKQGNPCCTEILLKGNQPSENCTLGPMRAKKQEKHSKTIYRTKKLAIQLHKIMEGQLLIITHSNCLKMSFFDESYPPTLKRGSSAIEDPIISLFSNLHALVIKISMKNLLWKWALASSIIE